MKRLMYLFAFGVLISLTCCPKQITISGYVYDSKDQAMAEVVITFNNEVGTTKTDDEGFYSKKLPAGWSGAATPAKEGFNFLPPIRSYSKLNADSSNQNFIGYTLHDIPNPPVNVGSSGEFGTIVSLCWKDNSTNEDGFIIRRTTPKDTTNFIEIGRVPADSTSFVAVGLVPDVRYYFQVSAFNKFGESKPVVTTPEIFFIIRRIRTLQALPRFNSILLFWKDNNENEDGFVIERDGEKIADVDDLPTNSRFYIDNNLNSIDNVGGGAGGLSKFTVLGYDQLFDGHLQIWTGTNAVYDGDDGDFTSSSSIVCNPPSSENDFEYTSATPDSLDPVVIYCPDSSIVIHQLTYIKPDENWVIIEWEIHNTADEEKLVKLSLFLDVDVGGNFSNRDYGNFNESENLVYVKNENETIFVGMAIVLDVLYYENYQISHFDDPCTPDNSNLNRNGEKARMELLRGNQFYVGQKYGTKEQGDAATDLTMTLISNLGNIAPQNSKRICYAISVEEDLTTLKNAIDEAKNFAQSVIFADDN